MPRILLRWIVLPILVILLLVEGSLWAFHRIPAEPPLEITLQNEWDKESQPFKNEVRLKIDSRQQTRSLGVAENGARKDGQSRIVCIGGAATFALLQNAPDTWWGQLRGLLEADGIKTDVIAWTAGGQEFVQALPAARWLSDVADDLKPDLVIVNLGVDDIIGHMPDYKYNKDRYSTLPASRDAGLVKRTAAGLSQIARLWKSAGRAKESARLQEQLGGANAQKTRYEQLKKQVGGRAPMDIPTRLGAGDPLLEYLDGLRIIQETAKARGIRLILTGEATLFDDSLMTTTHIESCVRPMPVLLDGVIERGRPDPQWVARELTRYAAAASKFATDNGVKWLDLNGAVERSLENFFTEQILTDKGAAAAAAVLLPHVKEALGRK